MNTFKKRNILDQGLRGKYLTHTNAIFKSRTRNQRVQANKWKAVTYISKLKLLFALCRVTSEKGAVQNCFCPSHVIPSLIRYKTSQCLAQNWFFPFHFKCFRHMGFFCFKRLIKNKKSNISIFSRNSFERLKKTKLKSTKKNVQWQHHTTDHPLWKLLSHGHGLYFFIANWEAFTLS